MKLKAHRLLQRRVPRAELLRNYRACDFSGDAVAGIIVTIMLVPQAIAYVMLAGLPVQVGLYAGIVPLFFYGIVGTSRTLAGVGFHLAAVKGPIMDRFNGT